MPAKLWGRGKEEKAQEEEKKEKKREDRALCLLSHVRGWAGCQADWLCHQPLLLAKHGRLPSAHRGLPEPCVRICEKKKRKKRKGKASTQQPTLVGQSSSTLPGATKGITQWCFAEDVGKGGGGN